MAIGRIGSSGWTTHNGCASNQTGLAIQRTERSGGQHAISIYGNKQRTLLLCREFNPDLVRNSTKLVFFLHHRLTQTTGSRIAITLHYWTMFVFHLPKDGVVLRFLRSVHRESHCCRVVSPFWNRRIASDAKSRSSHCSSGSQAASMFHFQRVRKNQVAGHRKTIY